MNLNWALGLFVCAVGNILIPPKRKNEDDIYECSEPGCHRKFMTFSGLRKHMKRQHLGVLSERKSCQHGCGKSYNHSNTNNALKFHERSCERNPNR